LTKKELIKEKWIIVVKVNNKYWIFKKQFNSEWHYLYLRNSIPYYILFGNELSQEDWENAVTELKIKKTDPYSMTINLHNEFL
jgi:hypothetical protein